jgi:Holliday junction resolvase RusA-like endonuclease
LILHFEIPGIPVSGNHRLTRTDHGVYVVKRAREFAHRVQSIAKAAAVLASWRMPDYVAVDLEIYNVNMDRDNVCKALMDPLQGIVFADDRRILDGEISRYKDGAGPRIIVAVREVDGKFYGFGSEAKAGSGAFCSRAI